MQRIRLVFSSIAAAVLVGSTLAFGADEGAAPDRPMPGMEQMRDGMKGGGMMGGGMMGMMNMMERCNRMMGGGTMGAGMFPQLPPGNEKLELQMQAEMMQRLGEILAKYAGQVKDSQGSTR